MSVGAGTQTIPSLGKPKLRRAQPETPQPHVLPAGYEIVALAGRGTFAEVWQVRHVQSQAVQALKQPRLEFREDPRVRKLMDRETRAGQSVRGPRVSRCLHFEPDAAYSLWEWAAGRSLADELERTQQIPVGRAVWIARQCAEGLADLERAGYAHGDLKPENVFVNDLGEVTLIDLGFARTIGGDDTDASERLLLGTPDYLAPEVLSSEPACPLKSDLYSLGVLLYRMLTGRLPFFAENPAEVMRLKRRLTPPPLRRSCPHAPRELAELVGRMTARQPIRRPSNVADVIDRLARMELTTLADRVVFG